MKSAIEVSFFGFGEAHDPPDHRKSESEGEDRADIDAEEFQSLIGREPDGAEIGP
jgi:hypothetical protein